MTQGIEFGIDGEPIPDDQAKAEEKPPALPGNTPVTLDGVLGEGDIGFDEANAQIFGTPPAEAWQYDLTPIYGGQQPSDQDLQRQMSIQKSLHAAGVPTVAFRMAVNAIAHGLKSGLPDASGLQLSIASCQRELERRHGKAGAVIFEDAHKYIDQLAAQDPDIGTALENSGAIANAGLLETLARVYRHGRKGA